MEHRLGRRIPVRLAVSISGKQSGILAGEIRDLSAEGAFIRMRTDVPDLRNIVRLSFAISATDQSPCECRALIVRKERDGLGVMFRRRQSQVFATLARTAEATEDAPDLATASSLPAQGTRPRSGNREVTAQRSH